jgi:adenylosuccinate synthase
MMPSTLEQLEAVEVVYESMPGWNTSIAHCRHFDELPKEAQK